MESQENHLFKLQDEFNKEKDQKDKINIQLNSTNINFSFLQLFKYSQSVQESYLQNIITNELINQIQEIENKYHISSKSIEIFFKFIEDEYVSISEEEYFDLYKLSKIFKVKSLEKCLQKYSQENSTNINFLISIILQQKTNKQEYEYDTELFSNDYISIDAEEILKNRINECLLNKKFAKLPISTIYRLLEKNNNQHTISGELLYDFINESIEERCSLLRFIQFHTFSDEKFNKLYNDYKQHHHKYFVFLQNDIEYIKQLRDDKKLLEKKIDDLERKNRENEMEHSLILKNLQEQTSKLIEENNELHSKINKITKENDEKQKRTEAKFEEKIKEITINKQKYDEEIKILSKEKNEQKSQIEDLNSQIIKLKDMLAKDKNQEEKNSVVQIMYDGRTENQFKGIIYKLSEGNAENLKNKKIIDVTSSSIYCNNTNKYDPWHAVNFNTRNSFWSENESDSWLCYDFIEKKVKPFFYSIRSNQFDSSGWHHPKSWVIEGSNNKINWINLDSKTNERSLDDEYVSNTFEITNKRDSKDFYRFLRIRQIGVNTRNAKNLTLSSLEFFGEII